MHKRHFPVSESSFKELVKKEQGEYLYHFVDKTLFIRDILENPRRVSLITRPRRFGKSTNFNMLSWFLDIRKKEESKELFAGLKIESAKLNNGKPCLDYRGKYPVIYMNFKTLGQDSYERFYKRFKNMVNRLYKEHRYLLLSDLLEIDEKEIIQKIINKQVDDEVYETALKELMSYLQKHFDERVFVLIDEYDTPFQQAIHHRLKSAYHPQSHTEPTKQVDYLDALKTLMGTFLGDALKDDESLENCVMTGIIRIAGAGIFSQLNNVDVWTVLDEPFSEYFGFTQEELDQLLIETDKTSEAKQFAEWYNGYEFGGKIIYNPLSVIKSLDRNKFGSYWLDTSNNMLIHDSLLKPRQESDKQIINEAVATWISGQAVEKSVDEHLVFDGNLNTLEHLWILLISSGYLKVVSKNTGSENFQCSLQIPNKEVFHLYQKVFVEWLYTFGVTEESPMIQHLLRGKAEEFCLALQKFFLVTLSVRDSFIGCGLLYMSSKPTDNDLDKLLTTYSAYIRHDDQLYYARKDNGNWNLDNITPKNDSGKINSFDKALKQNYSANNTLKMLSSKELHDITSIIGHTRFIIGAAEQNKSERYEAFYHGFMAATLGLSLSKTHAILESNREGGYGYYDLMLSPRDPHNFVYNKAIILEFKRAEKNEDVGKAVDEAFKQIIEKEYSTNIVERGVKDVVFIALAFCGKHLEFKHETMSVHKLKIKKIPGQEAESSEVFLRS